VGTQPIYCAAANGHASVTEQLIEARCNLDVQDNIGCTPLCTAAHFGHELCCPSVPTITNVDKWFCSERPVDEQSLFMTPWS
jgi:hypothetical protein